MDLAREFTARDDDFHFDLLGSDWWATETSWFSFHDVKSSLGGWLYTMVRPNVGTVAGGAWVWDDSASLPWEVLYSANYSALKLEPEMRLAGGTLANGVSISVVSPGMRYELAYEDGERFRLGLEFDGIMRPRPLLASGSTFGRAAHYDQFGRVRGTLQISDRQISIDCLAMRDRSWGRRPEDRPRRGAYVTGAATPDSHFLAVTNSRKNEDEVSYGFLCRDGVIESLEAGRRTVERNSISGYVSKVVLEARDTSGRELHAIGSPVSAIVLNRHSFIDVNSLIHWDMDDGVAWGEDQDMWPVHEWAQARRAGKTRKRSV